MRPSLASAVAATVLVAIPVGAGALGSSRPATSGRRLADEPFVRPYLNWASSPAAACRWTHRHTDVGCLLADGERCTVETERQRSVCVPGQQSVSAPVIGYGTPPSTGGSG